MKVTVIKGPNFKKAEKEAYKLLYQIISKKIQEDKVSKVRKEVI